MPVGNLEDLMTTRHVLVTDWGYTLFDIDRMYPFELDITKMLILKKE